MKKIYFLAFFYTTLSFSQTAKDFLINDNDKIYHTSITEVIAESKNYGYNLYRDDKGEYIFSDGMSKFITIIKKIDSPYDEGFPYYSVGKIFKKFLFTGDDLTESSIWKIESEMYLVQYDNVSISQIKNCYKKIKNDFLQYPLNDNYKIIEASNKLNYKSILSNYYDLVAENLIRKHNINDTEKDYFNERIYSIGEYFKNVNNINYYFLTFSTKDKGMAGLLDGINDLTASSNKAFENMRFTIGNQDLRKINQYDLEAMVKFFLEDCKKSNIKVPEIKTLNATFEPLQGDVIALSYAFGDDSLIKIKVDPENWAKSNIEKRWYVLYHELGHDILNLEHGQGGKMMFNFADKEYSWDDFFQDKEYMMNFKK